MNVCILRLKTACNKSSTMCHPLLKRLRLGLRVTGSAALASDVLRFYLFIVLAQCSLLSSNATVLAQLCCGLWGHANCRPMIIIHLERFLSHPLEFISMLEPILDLKKETQNVLKRCGHLDLCLQDDKIELLEELTTSLKPFKTFIDLFSCTMPTLSIIPVMKIKICKKSVQ